MAPLLCDSPCAGCSSTTRPPTFFANLSLTAFIDDFHLLVEEVNKLEDEVKNDLIERLNTFYEDYEFGSALEDETSETIRDLSGGLQVEDKKILIDALVNEGLYEIPAQFAVLASE